MKKLSIAIAAAAAVIYVGGALLRKRKKDVNLIQSAAGKTF